MGINFNPLESSEISALDNDLPDRLMTLGLTNLPSYLPSVSFASLVSVLLPSGRLSEDTPNLIALCSISDSYHSTTLNSNLSKHNEDSGSEIDTSSESLPDGNSTDTNEAKLTDGRYEGKFVSPNVINLSGRSLSKAEISLLSKGLKFIPTSNFVNKTVLKEELEVFGRKLRLNWHFRNEEKSETFNRFRPKSKFNPKGKDAAIEIYLSRLEEAILALDTNVKYSNITKEEREALKSLQKDTSIIIKEADKGSGIVVWDRDDYLKEAEKQLSDANTYEKASGDVLSPLINIVKSVLAKVKVRGDVPSETMDYFFVNNPKLGRFYLLLKIHKRLHHVPGRPVISVIYLLLTPDSEHRKGFEDIPLVGFKTVKV